MQDIIYKYEIVVNQILGYAPGLAFLSGVGVRSVRDFRTMVRGFSSYLGDARRIFRKPKLGFVNQLVDSVVECC
jgi:hypothetical protein